jgi:hypothetical protein
VRETETAANDAAAGETSSPVVELRDYTLHPGKREVLIELFDSEFVETQEAVGMKVIGQFRTLDDPDHFIWLRGFPDMPTRARALEAFYDGPVWKLHRDAANATMVASDNVLLLRPAAPHSGFVLDCKRPPPGSGEIPEGLIVMTIYDLDESSAGDFAVFFDHGLAPVLTDTGAAIVAVLVTETAANNFPRLPIREGEHVLVCFTAFADEAAHDRHHVALAQTRVWRELGSKPGTGLRRDPETWRLQPTARSQLRVR